MAYSLAIQTEETKRSGLDYARGCNWIGEREELGSQRSRND